jgi:spore germination protein
MIIHIVQSDETIKSIAEKYQVSVARLIQENDLMNPDNLVVGQTILIVYPKETYTVKEGDTLIDIAKENNVTVMELLRNNPYLLDREYLYTGEIIVISYADEKYGDIATNGYAYPYINKDILRKNLLFLTYLSIFSYTVKQNGNLDDIDDIEIINLAKSFRVAPIMVISNITPEGSADQQMFHNILNSQEKITNLIENIYRVAKTKGYYGINIDIPYTSEEDRQKYFDLITTITERFNKEDIKVFVTITPNSFKPEAGSKFEVVDYSSLSQVTNGIILLSYSWGYASEIPIEAAPFYLIEILLQYVLKQIPPDKITLGISNIGYIVEIPYVVGESRANAISNANAIQLASDVGAEINYNDINLSSYFFVIGTDNYLVYFHDIRAIETTLKVIADNGLHGLGIWSVMYFLAQTFLFINTQYNIIKVIK